MGVQTTNIIMSRRLGWLGFYGLILLSWWLVYDMSRGGGSFVCGPDVIRLLPFGGFSAYLPMWTVMMAAMMLPTIIPTLRTYRYLPIESGAGSAGWWGIVAGYSGVWLLGSAGFAWLQALALNNGLIDLTGVVTSRWLSAGLLLLAGGWQFTRTKESCQDACLTPMQFFLGQWKPGFGGGVKMGLDIGIVCVGCCWAIMGLAFVGGVMSLLWMGLATVFMVAEKLPDIGMHLRKPAGILLIGAGILIGLGAT